MQGPSSPNNKNIFTNLLRVVKSRCSIFKKNIIKQYHGVSNKYYSLFKRHTKPDVVVPKSPSTTTTMISPQPSALLSFSVAPQIQYPSITTIYGPIGSKFKGTTIYINSSFSGTIDWCSNNSSCI